MIAIYQITNSVNPKLYIGQTNCPLDKYFYTQGWSANSDNSRYRKKPLLYAAIRKHGIENFKIAPIMFVETREEANNWEILFIAACKSNDRKFGYNLAAGGGGRSGMPAWCAGKKIPKEITAKWGASQKKRFQTQPHPQKGLIRTAEQKKQISDSLKAKGICPSPEARFKAAQAIRQRTPEQRAEASRKAWITRRANCTENGQDCQ
jgi:group I intron endonuclease